MSEYLEKQPEELEKQPEHLEERKEAVKLINEAIKDGHEIYATWFGDWAIRIVKIFHSPELFIGIDPEEIPHDLSGAEIKYKRSNGLPDVVLWDAVALQGRDFADQINAAIRDGKDVFASRGEDFAVQITSAKFVTREDGKHLIAFDADNKEYCVDRALVQYKNQTGKPNTILWNG
jgi:hypothetical protein